MGGREAEDARIDALSMIEPLPALEAIVAKNGVSGTGSLSSVEWQTMESAMPPEERLTHRNLALWMLDRARSEGVPKQQEEESEEEDETLVKMLENGDGEEFDGDGGGGDDD